MPTHSQSNIAVREHPAILAARLIWRHGTALTLSRARDTAEATGRQGNGSDLKTVSGTQPLHCNASKFKFRRQAPLPHSLFPDSDP